MENNERLDVKIAKRLLSIKAVFFRPEEPFTWASGIKSPIYCDNRLTLTAPEVRTHVEEGLAEVIKREYPDVEVLMGTSTAGIAHAAIVGHIMNLPMGYVRSGNKDHGRQNRIEGKLVPGQKVVAVPVPKLDKEQDKYASATNPYWFACVAIKDNCKDFDFVTFTLEAMAWSGREYITPEYYERTLKNKRALNDDNAADMLDILFSNRLVDISIVFNWNDCIQWYNNCLKTGGTGLTSFVESHQAAFEAEMTQTIEVFLED